MFTGIVEEVGKIIDIRHGARSSSLVMEGKVIFHDLHVGDSVAVNGVCLTAVTVTSNTFSADVMSETLSKSSLGMLQKGSRVNLERAMAANGRFGGHIVSGHIDGTGVIERIQRDDNAIWYLISAQKQLMRYIVEKGSIAMDGISLTVAKIDNETFSVSIIPHTQKETILSSKKVGDIVNLENDVIGKYIDKFMNSKGNRNDKDIGSRHAGSNTITKEFLANAGF